MKPDFGALVAALIALCILCCGAGIQAAQEQARPATLMELMRRGDIDAARQLVSQQRADVNAAVDGEGNTPLHRVALVVPDERQQAWVAALLALGARVDARNGAGRTPLHVAARAGKLEAARALIDGRAEVNAVDGGYATPLLDAAETDRLEVARALLAAGANPDLKPDPRDLTHSALTIASLRGGVAMVELLLAGGADVNLPSARRTALGWARRGKHERVVEILTARGAVD